MVGTPQSTRSKTQSTRILSHRSQPTRAQAQFAAQRELYRRRAAATRHNAEYQRTTAQQHAQQQRRKATERKQSRHQPKPRRTSANSETIRPTGLIALSKQRASSNPTKIKQANEKMISDATDAWRPIYWSDEMKALAKKDVMNPLAGQYLWMDDETAPGSAAWLEKKTQEVLHLPQKKFEWKKMEKSRYIW